MTLLTSFKRAAPPFVFDAVKGRFGTRFRGRYSSWADVQRDCEGYDSAAILERVRESTRAVVSGKAAAERDGIELDEIEYAWPMLASLLWVACQNNSRLSVVDFGGSLGSTYRQNLRFFQGLDVKWGIVEQPSFVAAGKEEFENDKLRFFTDLQAAFAALQPNVLLLSGVLQYLEEPHKVLSLIFDLAPPFIVLDRTPFIDAPDDRLTVQIVSKRVHPGSYPAWFFSRTKLFQSFENRYEVVETFKSEDRANIPSQYLGAVLRRVQR